MTGIIGAMRVEVEQLRQRMENAQTRVYSGIEFVSGTLEGKPAVVAACGIGKVAAAVCTQTMILEYSPSLIVGTGVAGSVCAELGPMDVAVAAAAVQYDMDTSPLGDPKGLISGINMIELPCDAAAAERLERSLRGLGAHTARGVIATGDRFVNEWASAAAIAAGFGAIACDMESGAIAQVCVMNGTRFCLLRAISDRADSDSHLDYGSFLASAAELAANAVADFIRGL